METGLYGELIYTHGTLVGWPVCTEMYRPEPKSTWIQITVVAAYNRSTLLQDVCAICIE